MIKKIFNKVDKVIKEERDRQLETTKNKLSERLEEIREFENKINKEYI